MEEVKKPFVDPIAIIPPRNAERLFAQKGLFTLQGSDSTAMDLNSRVKNCFKKFILPLDAIPDAKRFLTLAGINHYSVFPDLDGLSKHLIEINNLKIDTV